MLVGRRTIRPGLYRLPDDPVGPRVLIPGFASATSVQGAFGWFTAGWIGRLAPGLAEYINRHDTTPITFTVAPTLFAAERTVVEDAYGMSADEASQKVTDVFVDGRAQASALGRHALDCLAWMIATARLRLRVAVPTPESNYHPKIWLFDDGMHQVLARGSGNATAHGVTSGVEHLDVDVTWIAHSRTRVREGMGILDDWANGRSQGIDRVVELPEALEQDIIQTAPEMAPNQSDYREAVNEDHSPAWAIDPAERLRARFAPSIAPSRRRLAIPTELKWQEGPYAHQGEAVTAWESRPEPQRGTISMATGAGKTITALICATRVQNQLANKPLLVVISAPSRPLLTQWQKEVLAFGLKAVAPSLEPNTDHALTNLFRGLATGGTHVAIVTNNLLCSAKFQSTVALKIGRNDPPVPTMLIADEAHTLGAKGFLSQKPAFFGRRLALSATPERQYDPDGTEQVFEFMGPLVYEFGLDRAIGFCLSPYNYYVHATTLDSAELEEFRALTRRIGAAIGSGIKDDDDTLTSLKIARRRIVETARSKLPLLQTVLEQRKPRSLKQVLIYASSKHPRQFNDIAAMLTNLEIRWAPVTQDTTARPTLLARTLAAFADGGYQVLLAKKVLDEGVDIPSIREAFIVASSTVEREWIQRRGRVLRRHPNKPWAIVHDFLALPPAQMLRSDETTSIKKIIRTELGRAYSFASHARNAAGRSGVLSDLERIRTAYWPDGMNSLVLRRAGDQAVASATPRGTPW